MQCGAARKYLTLCSYHVTCAFYCECTLCSCLDVKELFTRKRHNIWLLSNGNKNQSHNHFFRKHFSFHGNVKRRLRLEGRIIGKISTLPKHEDIVLNSITQTKEKCTSLVLSRADFWMVSRCHGVPYIHFFSCLEPTAEKNTWMRTISITGMVVISKVLFWKLLDIGYVHCSFATFTRHIDNGIWKALCSWRFYRNRSTYVPILF